MPITQVDIQSNFDAFVKMAILYSKGETSRKFADCAALTNQNISDFTKSIPEAEVAKWKTNLLKLIQNPPPQLSNGTDKRWRPNFSALLNTLTAPFAQNKNPKAVSEEWLRVITLEFISKITSPELSRSDTDIRNTTLLSSAKAVVYATMGSLVTDKTYTAEEARQILGLEPGPIKLSNGEAQKISSRLGFHATNLNPNILQQYLPSSVYTVLSKAANAAKYIGSTVAYYSLPLSFTEDNRILYAVDVTDNTSDIKILNDIVLPLLMIARNSKNLDFDTFLRNSYEILNGQFIYPLRIEASLNETCRDKNFSILCADLLNACKQYKYTAIQTRAFLRKWTKNIISRLEQPGAANPFQEQEKKALKDFIDVTTKFLPGCIALELKCTAGNPLKKFFQERHISEVQSIIVRPIIAHLEKDVLDDTSKAIFLLKAIEKITSSDPQCVVNTDTIPQALRQTLALRDFVTRLTREKSNALTGFLGSVSNGVLKNAIHRVKQILESIGANQIADTLSTDSLKPSIERCLNAGWNPNDLLTVASKVCANSTKTYEKIKDAQHNNLASLGNYNSFHRHSLGKLTRA